MAGSQAERAPRLPRTVGRLTPPTLLDRTGGRGYSAYGKPRFIRYENGSSILLGQDQRPAEIHIPSADPDGKTAQYKLDAKDKVGVDQTGKNLLFTVGERDDHPKTTIVVGSDYKGAVIATVYPKSPESSSSQ